MVYGEMLTYMGRIHWRSSVSAAVETNAPKAGNKRLTKDVYVQLPTGEEDLVVFDMAAFSAFSCFVFSQHMLRMRVSLEIVTLGSEE